MFWATAEEVSESALQVGALMPIATDAEEVEEEGVCYLTHVLTPNAKKKPIAEQTIAKKIIARNMKANPFLPYEQALFVAEAGSEHVCLLNKFPVLSPHLLICSKEFVPQSSLLNQADFDSWLLGFTEPDVFGFFNSGPVAGASQLHRHMQLVRTPIPLNTIISEGSFPFSHCVFPIDNHHLAAEYLYDYYHDAIDALGLGKGRGGELSPYNLLLSRNWMVVIPRTKNNIQGVFSNGFNYSGRFLVKSVEHQQWLIRYGLMNYLKECARG
ncbi:phosphorylase [Photobacterium makurazakiensis]|uniref:phosphorylase n=1 Tax=Photobacterium makurazakiensis TaxID=2910234 RepID=UPI003D12F246